jgi:hypothetical protein
MLVLRFSGKLPMAAQMRAPRFENRGGVSTVFSTIGKTDGQAKQEKVSEQQAGKQGRKQQTANNQGSRVVTLRPDSAKMERAVRSRSPLFKA